MYEINYDKFSRNLKRLLETHHLTVNDFAEKIDIRATTIYRYQSQSRTPELSYIIAIAKYFNVTIDWLLGLDPNETGLVDSERDLLDKYSLASEDDKRIVNAVLDKYSR